MQEEFGFISIIRKDGVKGNAFPITTTEIIIGRSFDCDIRIHLPKVNEKHCIITFKDGNAFCKPIGDSEVVINKLKLSCDCLLSSGDIVQIADRSLVFEYPCIESKVEELIDSIVSSNANVEQESQAQVANSTSSAHVSTPLVANEKSMELNLETDEENVDEVVESVIPTRMSEESVSEVNESVIPILMIEDKPAESSVSIVELTTAAESVDSLIFENVVDESDNPFLDAPTSAKSSADNEGRCTPTPDVNAPSAESLLFSPKKTPSSFTKKIQQHPAPDILSPRKKRRLSHRIGLNDSTALPLKSPKVSEPEESISELLFKDFVKSPASASKIDTLTAGAFTNSPTNIKSPLMVKLKAAQTPRKTVSFGPHLSPELFDNFNPPASPIKRGTPLSKPLPRDPSKTMLKSVLKKEANSLLPNSAPSKITRPVEAIRVRPLRFSPLEDIESVKEDEHLQQDEVAASPALLTFDEDVSLKLTPAKNGRLSFGGSSTLPLSNQMKTSDIPPADLLDTLVSPSKNFAGMKHMLKTPFKPEMVGLECVRKMVKTPKNQNMKGLEAIKNLVKTPKTTELVGLEALKHMIKTPSLATEQGLDGVKYLLHTPKTKNQNEVHEIKNGSTQIQSTSPIGLESLKTLLQTPVANSDMEVEEFTHVVKTPSAKIVSVSEHDSVFKSPEKKRRISRAVKVLNSEEALIVSTAAEDETTSVAETKDVSCEEIKDLSLDFSEYIKDEDAVVDCDAPEVQTENHLATTDVVFELDSQAEESVISNFVEPELSSDKNTVSLNDIASESTGLEDKKVVIAMDLGEDAHKSNEEGEQLLLEENIMICDESVVPNYEIINSTAMDVKCDVEQVEANQVSKEDFSMEEAKSSEESAEKNLEETSSISSTVVESSSFSVPKEAPFAGDEKDFSIELPTIKEIKVRESLGKISIEDIVDEEVEKEYEEMDADKFVALPLKRSKNSKTKKTTKEKSNQIPVTRTSRRTKGVVQKLESESETEEIEKSQNSLETETKSAVKGENLVDSTVADEDQADSIIEKSVDVLPTCSKKSKAKKSTKTKATEVPVTRASRRVKGKPAKPKAEIPVSTSSESESKDMEEIKETAKVNPEETSSIEGDIQLTVENENATTEIVKEPPTRGSRRLRGQTPRTETTDYMSAVTKSNSETKENEEPVEIKKKNTEKKVVATKESRNPDGIEYLLEMVKEKAKKGEIAVNEAKERWKNAKRERSALVFGDVAKKAQGTRTAKAEFEERKAKMDEEINVYGEELSSLELALKEHYDEIIRLNKQLKVETNKTHGRAIGTTL